MLKTLPVLSILGIALALHNPQAAQAATTCTFADDSLSMVMTLQGNCTTDETILVPDGYTLDGADYRITASDPSGDHFKGAVVTNAGTVAHITNLGVNMTGLSNVCDAGDDRLRGIMLEGAAGSISNSIVANVNQGASGCQEGNAIEVRNAPFDNTHPNTLSVEISHNKVENYQKTGILVNGDVSVYTHHNTVGASATQSSLAANSVQYGFGATGDIMNNEIEGNQWLGASDFVGTAVLLYLADNTQFKHNHVQGNSDVGVYGLADNLYIRSNIVKDLGVDGPHGDYGIGNWGTNSVVLDNRVVGFATPYDAMTETLVLSQNKQPSVFE